MGFPKCHMIIAPEDDDLIRLVVVPRPGEWSEYTNYREFLETKSTEYSKSQAHIFDASRSAVGYLTTSTMATTIYEFHSLEDVPQEHIDALIDRVRLRHVNLSD